MVTLKLFTLKPLEPTNVNVHGQGGDRTRQEKGKKAGSVLSPDKKPGESNSAEDKVTVKQTLIRTALS